MNFTPAMYDNDVEFDETMFEGGGASEDYVSDMEHEDNEMDGGASWSERKERLMSATGSAIDAVKAAPGKTMRAAKAVPGKAISAIKEAPGKAMGEAYNMTHVVETYLKKIVDEQTDIEDKNNTLSVLQKVNEFVKQFSKELSQEGDSSSQEDAMRDMKYTILKNVYKKITMKNHHNIINKVNEDQESESVKKDKVAMCVSLVYDIVIYIIKKLQDLNILLEGGDTKMKSVMDALQEKSPTSLGEAIDHVQSSSGQAESGPVTTGGGMPNLFKSKNKNEIMSVLSDSKYGDVEKQFHQHIYTLIENPSNMASGEAVESSMV
jgi:hypothetical protein